MTPVEGEQTGSLEQSATVFVGEHVAEVAAKDRRSCRDRDDHGIEDLPRAARAVAPIRTVSPGSGIPRTQSG